MLRSALYKYNLASLHQCGRDPTMEHNTPVFVNLPNGRMFLIPYRQTFERICSPLTMFELNLFNKGDTVMLCGQKCLRILDRYSIEREIKPYFIFLVNKGFYVKRVNLSSLCERRSKLFKMRENSFELINRVYSLKLQRLSLLGNSGWNTTFVKEGKNYPCPRFDHSFVVDDKGEFGYLVGGFTELMVKDGDKHDWIYYPTDDLWQINLKTNEWTRIIDFSVPFPTNTTQLSSIPAGFVNLNIFYDELSHSIVGCGTRVHIDRYPVDNVWRKDCSFIIDIAKQTYHIIEDAQSCILRLSKFRALALSETPLWMFRNLSQPKHHKSHYCWYGDSNRKLKENLIESISQKMTKVYPSKVLLSDQYAQSSHYRDFFDSLTWSNLMKVDKWFLEFESPKTKTA